MEQGIIFCSFGEAVQEHPELVREVPRLGGAGERQLLRRAQQRRVLRRLVRLRAEGRACPMELSTYFRINAAETGQFERTLIVADEGAYVSYLEGCTAPKRDEQPAARGGGGAGGARRAPRSSTRRCRTGTPATRKGGAASTTSSPSAARRTRTPRSRWTQVETGSAITWKYPERDPAGRQLGGRVLLGGGGQRPAAGRHRHQDDPHRQEHEEHDRLEGHLGGAGATTATAAW